MFSHCSQGKTWQDTRTKVNPVMMNPKTVKSYIGAVDQISTDFVQRIRMIRERETQEMPNHFINELNKWSLESISYIALNQRLGLLTEGWETTKGQELIQAVQVFLNLAFRMEIMPSMWRYYETADYKKVMIALHTVTK